MTAPARRYPLAGRTTAVPQHHPLFDLPAASPSVDYVLAATPRTGSTVLSAAMRRRGCFGWPQEYALDVDAPGWIARAGTARYLDYVRSVRTSPNGCFGLKLMHAHLGRFLALERPERVLATKFVLLTRPDLVGQAASWERAAQTGVWTSLVSADEAPVFNADGMQRWVREAAEAEAGWRLFLASLGLPTLELTFEHVTGDPEDCLRQIADFLEIELPDVDGVPAGWRPQPQAVAPGERWEDDYVHDRRARFLRGVVPA